ncbi:MFS transporter [Streptomyces noursei]|uniref:MFS transporter n=1 Tax=Streptomyces noursei TaxID=1971 RepID=UPI00045EF954|nr:MFS transporter [Streptomyces noursei]AIA08549.1 drug resistance efflux protein [Streptomyces noursei]
MTVTTELPGTNTPPEPRGRAAGLALLSVCLGYFMVLLDGSALNIALPSIQQDVHGTMSTLQWLVNLYTIPLASLLLSSGALADRVGSRKVFMWALSGFALTSLLCALSPNLGVLIACRALQGVAAAGVLPTTLAIIARNYPVLADRAKAITVWGATGGIALVVGPIGGGLLTQTFGWRSIFLVNVPVGAFALWLSWRYAQETERRMERSYDLFGQLTAIASLGLIVAALIEGGARGWTAPYTLVLGAAGLLSLLAFALVEKRVAAPMLPLAMFRRRAFSAAITAGFAYQFGAFGLQFIIAIFIEAQWGYSASEAGTFLLPFAVLLTIGTSYLNRRWKTRGMRWLLLVGSSIATIGTVLCLAAGDEKTWPILAIGFGITGLGGGILAPSINGAALAEADSQYSGIASGVLNTFRQMGLAVGVAVLGAILAGGNRVTDLRIDLAIGALCFLTVALLSRRHIHR